MGISSTLPSTGYIKLIDIWMIFTMTYPFFIIISQCIKEVSSQVMINSTGISFLGVKLTTQQ